MAPGQGTMAIQTLTEPEQETVATALGQETMATALGQETIAVPIIWTLATMIPSKDSITSEYWMPFLQT
jgi:hypothetical protein